MKSGDRVKMSNELKILLRGACGKLGKHQGPFHEGECWGCSSAHLDEFGDCIGIVEGLTDYGSRQGPEVDVRWLPKNLRYAYLPEHLVKD